MISNRNLFLSVLALGIGISGQAFASTSTGTVTYQFTGYTADAGCTTAPPTMQRENFTESVTDADESIFGDSLSFSLCNDPGTYTGGIFSLTVPDVGLITGTITAVELSDSIANSIESETVQGTFTVTSAIDNGYTDAFYASTQSNIHTGAGSGTFIVGTPEPATLCLTGFGLVAAAFVKRRRSARS